MMRKYVLFTCAVLVVLGLLFWHSRLVHEDAEAPAVSQGLDTVPMLITQVQQCARLYTAEYRVHNIVTHDDDFARYFRFHYVVLLLTDRVSGR